MLLTKEKETSWQELLSPLPIPAAQADEHLSLLWENQEADRRFPYLRLKDGIPTLLSPNQPAYIIKALTKGDQLSLPCGHPASPSCTVHLIPMLEEGRLSSVLLLFSEGWPAACSLPERLFDPQPLSARLRAPLAVCFSALHLMGRESEEGQISTYCLSAAENSCYSLLRELTNLNALSSYLGGHVIESFVCADLGRYVSSFCQAAGRLLRPMGYQLSVHVPAKPVCVSFDPDSVSMALVNLLDNACRYGGDQIRFSLHVRDAMAFLTVSDDGPGLSPLHTARIFEPFYSSHPDGVDHSGSGVGLALVKLIALSHGGAALADGSDGMRVSMRMPLSGDQTTSQPSVASIDPHNRFSTLYVGLTCLHHGRREEN